MRKELYLAGGCFWGTQKYLDHVRGVESTQVGYANGNTQNPTYQEVCSKNTGHAETVKVEYEDSMMVGMLRHPSGAFSFRCCHFQHATTPFGITWLMVLSFSICCDALRGRLG